MSLRLGFFFSFESYIISRQHRLLPGEAKWSSIAGGSNCWCSGCGVGGVKVDSSSPSMAAGSSATISGVTTLSHEGENFTLPSILQYVHVNFHEKCTGARIFSKFGQSLPGDMHI